MFAIDVGNWYVRSLFIDEAMKTQLHAVCRKRNKTIHEHSLNMERGSEFTFDLEEAQALAEVMNSNPEIYGTYPVKDKVDFRKRVFSYQEDSNGQFRLF